MTLFKFFHRIETKRFSKVQIMEFWKTQLSFDHNNLKIFIISQWQRDQNPNIAYLTYRWSIAAIFLVNFVMGIVDFEHPLWKAKWAIYLTNWGYISYTFQSILAALILTGCVIGSQLRNLWPNLQRDSLRFYKIYWATNIIATDLAFSITIIYWSIIYKKTTLLDINKIFGHVINSVLMLVDLFMVSHPIKLLHCCYPVALGVGYSLFSAIFFAAGGTSREGHFYIYEVLDWRQPLKSIATSLVCVCGVLLIHIVSWGLYKFRLFIHKKCTWKKIQWNYRNPIVFEESTNMIADSIGLN